MITPKKGFFHIKFLGEAGSLRQGKGSGAFALGKGEGGGKEISLGDLQEADYKTKLPPMLAAQVSFPFGPLADFH